MNALPDELKDAITANIAPLSGEWSYSETVRFPLSGDIDAQISAIESVGGGVKNGFVGTEDGTWRVFRPTLE